jgi:hypothetical protein
VNRREFIAGTVSAAACPLAAWAQQPALPVIGILVSATVGCAVNNGPGTVARACRAPASVCVSPPLMNIDFKAKQEVVYEKHTFSMPVQASANCRFDPQKE